MNMQVEKHESKFITSKDYMKNCVDLYDKFFEYYDKYIPDGIVIEQAESDCDKLIAYCKSKDAKIHEILTVFVLYFRNIPIDEMVDWMKIHNQTTLSAKHSYYNAHKYSKVFRR